MGNKTGKTHRWDTSITKKEIINDHQTNSVSSCAVRKHPNENNQLIVISVAAQKPIISNVTIQQKPKGGKMKIISVPIPQKELAAYNACALSPSSLYCVTDGL